MAAARSITMDAAATVPSMLSGNRYAASGAWP
jgi:hypothetical protein